MKKLIFLLISLLIFVLLSDIVFSKPMPWGIALNHEVKECAGYWGGDEFTSYALPSGWKNYYPDYSKYEETGRLIIETEIGNCDFSTGNEEDCCNQLGYTFVAQNIGKGGTTGWGMVSMIAPLSFGLFFILLIFFAILFIILKIKTKLFIPFLKNYTKKGLFIGAILGLLTSLSVYSSWGFVEFINPFRSLLMYISFPVYKVVFAFFEEQSISAYIPILILNLLYFGLIGWILGLLTQKIRKK